MSRSNLSLRKTVQFSTLTGGLLNIPELNLISKSKKYISTDVVGEESSSTCNKSSENSMLLRVIQNQIDASCSTLNQAILSYQIRLDQWKEQVNNYISLLDTELLLAGIETPKSAEVHEKIVAIRSTLKELETSLNEMELISENAMDTFESTLKLGILVCVKPGDDLDDINYTSVCHSGDACLRRCRILFDNLKSKRLRAINSIIEADAEHIAKYPTQDDNKDETIIADAPTVPTPQI